MSNVWVFEWVHLCCCLLLYCCLSLSSCLLLSSCDSAEIWIGRRSVKCGNETFFGSAGNLHQIHLIHYNRKLKWNAFDTLSQKNIWYTTIEIYLSRKYMLLDTGKVVYLVLPTAVLAHLRNHPHGDRRRPLHCQPRRYWPLIQIRQVVIFCMSKSMIQLLSKSELFNFGKSVI